MYTCNIFTNIQCRIDIRKFTRSRGCTHIDNKEIYKKYSLSSIRVGIPSPAVAKTATNGHGEGIGGDEDWTARERSDLAGPVHLRRRRRSQTFHAVRRQRTSRARIYHLVYTGNRSSPFPALHTTRFVVRVSTIVLSGDRRRLLSGR